jgi:hypothetical protein
VAALRHPEVIWKWNKQKLKVGFARLGYEVEGGP